MTTTTSKPTERLVDPGHQLGLHVKRIAQSVQMRVHEARTKGDRPTQGHLTLTFPMRSAGDGAAVRDQFPALVADDFRSILGDIPSGALLYRMYGKADRAAEKVYIGSVTLESGFVASAFGDRILAFQHAIPTKKT